MNKNGKIVILGGGPTGLGAAWKLNELGYKNWKIFESSDNVGGHSSSHKDLKGFTWDEGGHIFFSNIKYFNNIFERVFLGKYYIKKRYQSILFSGKFIPYPFQNHIRYLPKNVILECLYGLVDIIGEKKNIKNFFEFIKFTMGDGISKHFMIPYNSKVWSWPLDKMNAEWIAERVSLVDIKKLINHIVTQKDDVLWGPNAFFKYPKMGGSGAFWKEFLDIFPKKIFFQKNAIRLNIKKKLIYFSDNSQESYDFLISTLPLDNLIFSSNSSSKIKALSKKLKHNSGFLVGLGINGKQPKILDKKIALYFPDYKWSFHRATILRNFSTSMTPPNTWSILFEASFSKNRKLTINKVESDAKRFLKDFDLIKSEKDIMNVWKKRVPYFYPIPTIGLQDVLYKIQKYLLKHDIFSRGRFGNWRYEIGNMDHSFMLGVDAVNHIEIEKEKTFKIYED